MAISISSEQHIARLRADLRMGLPVAVQADDAIYVMAATETLGPEMLNQLRALDVPLHLVLTRWRAETLAAPAYDGDIVRVAMPVDALPRWVWAMGDPSLDLAHPMKGPFRYLRDGKCAAQRAGVRLAKSAALLPALVVAELQSVPNGINCVPLSALDAEYLSRSPLALVSGAKVPLRVARDARVHVYRRRDGGEEHYAIEVGQPDRSQPVLSRLHSACFTGDLIGSLKCDCGPQLNAALDQIGGRGAGVLLYLNQEGRGIGLANKMRAYALQDQGFDTVEANHRLGFEDDERDFRLGSEILRMMGFKSVALMTNNPAKIARMEEAGIIVTERVPLRVGNNPLNQRYLDTKAAKSGHLL